MTSLSREHDFCHVQANTCREYPHTDRVNQYQLLKLHEKNAGVFPAVERIFDLIADF